VRSVKRALQIMEILASSDNNGLGVTRLSQDLNLDKSTVYRLLSTLGTCGYVEQEPETKKYNLSLKIVELSNKVLDKIELGKTARPFMKELVQRLNEAAHLAILVEKKVIYIGYEGTFSVISIKTEVGKEAPGYCTAVGKVLWAYLPEEELDEILQTERLTQLTPRTITSPSELKMHLRNVREKGYAFDDEEFAVGVRCVAVPVWENKGKVIASFGISALATRITLDRIEEVAKVIKKVRDKLCPKLGWRGRD